MVIGQQQVDIARDLGMTQAWMSIVCNSPAFQDYVAKLRERTENKIFDIRGEINKGAVEGVQVLVSLLRDPDATPSVKARVAMDLLDRDGWAPSKKIEVTETRVVLTADRLQELKDRRERMLSASKMNVLDIAPAIPQGRFPNNSHEAVCGGE